MEVTDLAKSLKVALFIGGCVVQTVVFTQKNEVVFLPNPDTFSYNTNPDLPASNRSPYDTPTFFHNRYVDTATTASPSAPPDETD